MLAVCVGAVSASARTVALQDRAADAARLVARGEVAEERIDASARRILLVKFRLGLFDDPYVDEDEARRARASRLPPDRPLP